MLFLIPSAERVVGRVCPLVILRLIRRLRNALYQSPRNKVIKARVSPRQAVPFFFHKFTKLCTYLRYRMFLSSVSSLERYIISRDLAFFCLDFYSGERATDLGRVYTKEVLLLPEDQGLLFHQTFGKTLRGNDSKNQFAVKRCPQDTMVCPVVNLTTYVKIADFMNINLREGTGRPPSVSGGRC